MHAEYNMVTTFQLNTFGVSDCFHVLLFWCSLLKEDGMKKQSRQHSTVVGLAFFSFWPNTSLWQLDLTEDALLEPTTEAGYSVLPVRDFCLQIRIIRLQIRNTGLQIHIIGLQIPMNICELLRTQHELFNLGVLLSDHPPRDEMMRA